MGFLSHIYVGSLYLMMSNYVQLAVEVSHRIYAVVDCFPHPLMLGAIETFPVHRYEHWFLELI